MKLCINRMCLINYRYAYKPFILMHGADENEQIHCQSTDLAMVSFFRAATYKEKEVKKEICSFAILFSTYLETNLALSYQSISPGWRKTL